MFKNIIARLFNLSVFVAFLPCLAGCNESASGSAISDIASTVGSSAGGGSSALVTPISGGAGALHAPEPATMLMVGGGILALRFLSRRSK